MQVGFAERDGAGAEQRLDNHGVALRPIAGKPGRAAGGCVFGGVEIVLQRQRHAVELAEGRAGRALPVGFAGGGADALGVKRDEGVEIGVRRGARQQRVGERLGRGFAGADRVRRLGHSKVVKLPHGHAL